MGGIAIEKVREGVQFVPDAAAAFRRADAQVVAEFGRHIDVNSTYRSWSDQMKMFTNWDAYVGGWGPYPGHSKAVHPDDSFHVSGLALDSDDWVNARIVDILAENGFIRNRLYVAGENHHFEYIRSRDENYGRAASAGSATAATITLEEDEMKLLYITDSVDGNNLPGWALLNVRTGKVLPMRADAENAQSTANSWARAWGNARFCNRQDMLNAIAAIKQTA